MPLVLLVLRDRKKKERNQSSNLIAGVVSRIIIFDISSYHFIKMADIQFVDFDTIFASIAVGIWR